MGTRKRLLKEEEGFTLPEMMVTIMVMVMVLLALHSIFDMSLRVFAFGNNKVEAVENARLGLEKMEREIRAAYPVNSNDAAAAHLFFIANDTTTTNPQQAVLGSSDLDADQITFGNELGAEGAGNGKIECLDLDTCEYITYKLTVNNDASNAACTVSPCDLRRVNTANSSDSGAAVVENVVPNGLTYTFYESDGTTAESESEITKVSVRLRITVSPGTDYEATQNLTTEIDLRNRQ